MSTLLVNTVKDVAAAHTLDMTSFPGVQSFRITSSADTALGTCASGGTRIGSSFSASIPTAGLIRVTLSRARFTYTGAGSAGMSAGMGIEVNGTTYFVQHRAGPATLYYLPGAADTSGVNTNYWETLNGTGYGALAGLSTNQAVYDIAGMGFSTGTQTCYIRCGHTANPAYTDAVTVKGTATAFVASVEIIGFSA